MAARKKATKKKVAPKRKAGTTTAKRKAGKTTAKRKAGKTTAKRKAAAKTPSKKAAKKKATPWEKPAPARAKHTKLSKGQKDKAKQRARRAGRPYPNLVDNMKVAKDAKN